MTKLKSIEDAQDVLQLAAAIVDASRSVRMVSQSLTAPPSKEDAKGWYGAARTMAKKMVSDQGRERTRSEMPTPVYWPVGGALAR